jgi:uncharacterized protein (DUF2235 family)
LPEESIVQVHIHPAGGKTPSGQTGKKIVVFADGTGSAFSSQESNIWRLYQALDKTQGSDGTLQLARYIQGVGTSSIGIIRYLDGATGLGVPGNVRKLYRFLCWNWQPGDEIHLFGFSRGAFTVRTLAGMIAMQGLMPADVTSAEMNRNALGAWRAYRKETAPLLKDGWLQMNPLISVVREVRDALTWAKRRLFRQRTHGDVVDSLPSSRQPGAVKIRFMGLFDTVEAYGLPVEEMLAVVDRLVWPIRFRNNRCSPVVEKVRHALSLDEERRSFHPLRFTQGPRPDGKQEPDTQERWFAGVHSDVGGGYPNDEIAFEPLLWLADEAKGDLTFDADTLARYRARLFPQAMINDSRKGLAMLYRYGPRPIEAGDAHGGLPLVDLSVLRKIREGADGYAPLTLQEEFRVAMQGPQGPEVQAGLIRNREAAEQVARLIGRRTATNWVTIFSVLGLILPPLVSLYRACREGGTAGVIECAFGVATGAVTAVPRLWLENWPWYLGMAVLLAAMFVVNDVLAGRIKDRSRQLWQPRPLPLQSPDEGR